MWNEIWIQNNLRLKKLDNGICSMIGYEFVIVVADW